MTARPLTLTDRPAEPSAGLSGVRAARALTLALEGAGPFDPDALTLREARARADAFYREHGRKASPAAFLHQNDKLALSSVYTAGLSLRPADASGLEVCIWRTDGCTAACVLETSFRGKGEVVRDGRTMRTLFLAADPQAFVTLLAGELRRLVKRYGAVLFRPNVASDLRWERIAPALLTLEGVRAYDYTKADPIAHRDSLEGAYRLVYSVSERPASEATAVRYLRAGGTAAVVFAAPKHRLPATWHGFPVIDGDLSDDRTADPRGVVVGLAAKADGKRDASGFVRPAVAS